MNVKRIELFLKLCLFCNNYFVTGVFSHEMFVREIIFQILFARVICTNKFLCVRVAEDRGSQTAMPNRITPFIYTEEMQS